jgi:aldehyde dehydrogenase (NAD+)/aldehyde dehydrogenase
MANVTKPVFKDRYDNFIGGKFVAPVKGQYFDNPSPVDGKVYSSCSFPGRH